MNDRPPLDGGEQSLRDHAVAKAAEARLRRGGLIDRAEMMRLLEDRAVVRYPLSVGFDAEPLRPGEFACLQPLGDRPSDGFRLFIHPVFAADDDLLPLLIAYYIPSVNYGDIATHVEAELFGSTLLGVGKEEYYRILCAAADSVGPQGSDNEPGAGQQ